MATIQTVRCPNCGSLAERHHLPLLSQIKTQCDVCDYLLVTIDRTGKVVESYAPGLCPAHLAAERKEERRVLRRLSSICHQQNIGMLSSTWFRAVV